MYALGNELNGYNALMTSIEKRRIFYKEHPHYNCENLAILWMVAFAPLGAFTAGTGAMRAGWWAYRNPILVAEFASDFSGSLLPGSPASSYAGASGFAASYIYGYEKW